jgi:hypothetical protein
VHKHRHVVQQEEVPDKFASVTSKIDTGFEVNTNALDSIMGGTGVAEVSSKEMRKSVYFGALRVAKLNKSYRTEQPKFQPPVTPRRQTLCGRGGYAPETPKSTVRKTAHTRDIAAAPALTSPTVLAATTPGKSRRRQFGIEIASPGGTALLAPMSAKKQQVLTRRFSLGGAIAAPAFEDLQKAEMAEELNRVRLEEEELELELEMELAKEEEAIAIAQAAVDAASVPTAIVTSVPTQVIVEGGKRLTVMSFTKSSAFSKPAAIMVAAPAAAAVRKFGGGRAFKPAGATAAAQVVAVGLGPEPEPELGDAKGTVKEKKVDQQKEEEDDDTELCQIESMVQPTSERSAAVRVMENPVLRAIGGGDPRACEFAPITVEDVHLSVAEHSMQHLNTLQARTPMTGISMPNVRLVKSINKRTEENDGAVQFKSSAFSKPTAPTAPPAAIDKLQALQHKISWMMSSIAATDA